MHPLQKRILPTVQKPARYVGGEYGQIVKDKAQIKVRMALCFPDTYEIGMSNLGLHILYGCINQMPHVWCERAFAPWGDMEGEMRKHGISLYGLESGDPLGEFDLIGFSLGYEMAYTNVLNMLELAGLPVRAEERTGLGPIVLAGGSACYNPEPLADFIDLFVLGEGEELDREVIDLYAAAKESGWDKQTFLRRAAGIEGVYVPSLYQVEYHPDGRLLAMEPAKGAPERVRKRVIADLDSADYPVHTIVPSTEIVHDRVVLEVFRGCIRGCRFCQAGYIYRPVRAKSRDKLVEQGTQALLASGYQEITLSSLSTSDYRQLGQLCDGLLSFCAPRHISLSLPSLRADNFSMELMQKVQAVRKTGLTFAPEAGTQRLRDVINKNVTEEEILNTCRIAFEGGWNGIKLYFMLGLPTETDEDVLGIAALSGKVLAAWKKHAANKSRGVRITVSTSCFVPKPHTPFQWEAQVSGEEYMRRVRLLREAMPARAITYNWHDPDTSLIEAALSRGDRRLGAVLEAVWRDGGRLDAWSEYFSMARWRNAFSACGIDPDFYAGRQRAEEELLPWDRIDTGVRRAFLWNERARAYRAELSPDCRVQCTGCGANQFSLKGVCDA